MVGIRRVWAVGLLLALFAAGNAFGAPRKHHRVRRATTARRPVIRRTSRTAIRRRALASARSRDTRRGVIHARGRSGRHRILFNPWSEPTFAEVTGNDRINGDDPVIRKAAVDALGPYNGSVVVVNPQNGRILTMVNQKLGLTGAYQPCSTVKVVVSLASLSEGIVDAESPLRLTRRYSMTMTQALAHSNNAYFARLGETLGFERVCHYAKLFGLGEKAGFDIPGEEPGTVASEIPSDGLGMMTSFGSGIRLTPLELASIITSVANGGTMYYLQYPQTKQEIDSFQPKVKRHLEIGNLIPAVKAGMMGAVEYGTARRANFNPEAAILGKTGTCTDTEQPGVHLGWFGSFNDVGKNKLVVVVLLTGGRGVSGPIASGIAGQVYRNLSMQNYFAEDRPNAIVSPISLISMPAPGIN